MIKFDFALLDNDLYKNNLLRKEEIFDKFNNSNNLLFNINNNNK